MAIVESRLKDGTLTLGTTPTTIDFSCQVTNVRINSTYDDDGDAVETLCGDQIPPGRKLGGRSLAGTIIQDWTAPTSIVDFLWTHDLEEMAFEYVPNVEGPTITGTVRLEVPGETYGGDVNTRITSDFEWGMTSEVIRTPPVMADPASAGKAKEKARGVRLMADEVGVRIEGLAALTRTMRKAGEDLGDLKDANRAAGDIVAGAAAAMAPRRSGRLASSIRPARAAGRARVMAGRASVPYAAPIHWGWPARRIGAQPFLSQAAQQTEATWLPKYLTDIQAALDKVTGA